jgi:small subunit ribosomal protein S5
MASSEQYELREKLVFVNRTAKVVKGGRVFKFSALVVVGDGHGKIGFGLGKSGEVPAAMKKAINAARKNMFQVNLRDGTIQHPLVGRHGACKVIMFPAPKGSGMIAGGPMRAVFDVMGMEDIKAKSFASNPNNVIIATIKALRSMESPRSVAQRRGISVSQVLRGAHKEHLSNREELKDE